MAPNIVNLGSSFAAGVGIPPAAHPAAAKRSEANYASILAKRLNAKLTDLSVSGATLLNILNEPQEVSNVVFPPQIEGVPENADIVLVLGGGNDTGYVGGIVDDEIQAIPLVSSIVRLCTRMFANVARDTADEAELTKRYCDVLDAIHSKAPKARVIAIEYLTLFGSHAEAEVDVRFNRERIAYHKDVAAKMAKAALKAVESREAWCELLPVAAQSHDHDIASPEPWAVGFCASYLWGGPAAYHPNSAGMQAVADMLFDRVNAQKSIS